MRRRLRLLAALAIGGALFLALAGCGSSTEDSSTPRPTAVDTTEPLPTVVPTDIVAETSTPVPTETDTPTVAPTASPEPTAAPPLAVSPTPIPAPAATPTATATSSPAATPTPGPTATPVVPPGGIVTAAVGENFIVSFEVDPTSSFTWQLDELPAGSLLSLIDEVTIAPDVVSTNGWQHFVFRGGADGQATLTFWLVAAAGSPMDMVRYSVIIGSGSPTCSEVFEIDVGDEFEVVLETNSSTGFRWELLQQPDTAIVELVKEEYIASTSEAVGVSGWQRFTFRGIADGETDLDFWYVRPFDDPPAPANVANFKAIVGTGIPGCSAIFTIEVGETFDINLSSNPSTGYRWEINDIPTPGIIILAKDEFLDDDDDDSVGNAGVQRLTFEGIGEGETPLKLWYVRFVDGQPEPSGRIAFMVFVNEP